MTTDPHNDDTVGLLLSGGLDSAVLLGQLLQSGRRVRPFYVRCGLSWETAEATAIAALLKAIGPSHYDPLIVFDMPLADLYGNHWSVTGRDAPDAQSTDEAVYLPGRNALLTIKPALWCAMHGIEELALGVLGTSPFADATSEFFARFEAALEQAAGGRVRLSRPFAELKKRDVMRLGRGMPLELTFSCIAPVGLRHCGMCNKCAERQRAFCSIDAEDPTEYAGRQAAPLTR